MGYDFRYLRKPEGEAEAVKAAREVWDAALAARDALPKEEAGTPNFDKIRATGDIGPSQETSDGMSDRWAEAQKAVMAASRGMSAAETSYFRLNIWGMGEYRPLMEAFGMVADGPEPEGDWPDAEAYGMEHDEWEQVEYPQYFEEEPPLSAEMRANAERYLRDRNARLSYHGGDSPVIPVHKLCSNDGWIVTPDECRAAVAAWQKACAEAGAGDAALGRKVLTEAMDEHDMAGGHWLRWIAYIEGAAGHGGFAVH